MCRQCSDREAVAILALCHSNNLLLHAVNSEKRPRQMFDMRMRGVAMWIFAGVVQGMVVAIVAICARIGVTSDCGWKSVISVLPSYEILGAYLI